MLLQAVVDSKYRFTNLCVGWPGSVHDARVFLNSTLSKQAVAKNILTGKKNGLDVSPFLIGDSAYPLLTWLMKSFSESECLIEQQKCCNYHLSRARIVIQYAFGWLKARWRRLMKQNDMYLSNVPRVITAC